MQAWEDPAHTSAKQKQEFKYYCLCSSFYWLVLSTVLVKDIFVDHSSKTTKCLINALTNESSLKKEHNYFLWLYDKESTSLIWLLWVVLMELVSNLIALQYLICQSIGSNSILVHKALKRILQSGGENVLPGAIKEFSFLCVCKYALWLLWMPPQDRICMQFSDKNQKVFQGKKSHF